MYSIDHIRFFRWWKTLPCLIIITLWIWGGNKNLFKNVKMLISVSPFHCGGIPWPFPNALYIYVCLDHGYSVCCVSSCGIQQIHRSPPMEPPGRPLCKTASWSGGGIFSDRTFGRGWGDVSAADGGIVKEPTATPKLFYFQFDVESGESLQIEFQSFPFLNSTIPVCVPSPRHRLSGRVFPTLVRWGWWVASAAPARTVPPLVPFQCLIPLDT